MYHMICVNLKRRNAIYLKSILKEYLIGKYLL